jgi:hypothetical protein
VERYGVSGAAILMRCGERRLVGGQEDQLIDIALEIARRRRALNFGDVREPHSHHGFLHRRAELSCRGGSKLIARFIACPGTTVASAIYGAMLAWLYDNQVIIRGRADRVSWGQAARQIGAQRK